MWRAASAEGAFFALPAPLSCIVLFRFDQPKTEDRNISFCRRRGGRGVVNEWHLLTPYTWNLFTAYRVDRHSAGGGSKKTQGKPLPLRPPFTMPPKYRTPNTKYEIRNIEHKIPNTNLRRRATKIFSTISPPPSAPPFSPTAPPTPPSPCAAPPLPPFLPRLPFRRRGSVPGGGRSGGFGGGKSPGIEVRLWG